MTLSPPYSNKGLPSRDRRGLPFYHSHENITVAALGQRFAVLLRATVRISF